MSFLHYQQLQNGSYIPWKAVSSASADAVEVITGSQDIDPAKLKFEVNGIPVTANSSGSGTLRLDLLGKSQGIVEELLATYGDDSDKILGKLNLVSYDKIDRNLVIVPVNNPTFSNLSSIKVSDALSKIFGQAVAGWKVSVAPSLTVTLPQSFDDGESGLLSNYTGDMKKVIKAFGNLQDNTYYLFLVNNTKSGSAARGYMPRSKQAGFIFSNNHGSEADLIRTIAHELGHGAFNLKHTFSEYTALPQGTTDNLMDYSTGTALFKYQWDYVHDPQKVIPLFEGDEEGALASLPCIGLFDDCDDVLKKLEAIKKAYKEHQTITGKIPYTAANKVLNANGIKIAEIDYNFISIHFTGTADKEYVIDPKLYIDYDEQVRSALGGTVHQRGFAFKDGEQIVFKILLAEDTKEKFLEKKEKLKKYLFEGEKILDGPKEIIIHYKRKGRNKYRTWGEFTILGTDYKGYILERPKGENPTKLEDYKRHPAGTFNIGYSENSGGSAKFNYVTLYIVEHPAYKLHCGNRADQSDGCLLINFNSPELDKYPEAYQSYEKDVNKPTEQREDNPDRVTVANHYPPGGKDSHKHPNNPALKLREKVYEMEEQIKTKYNLKEVVKKIIIDETEEKLEL